MSSRVSRNKTGRYLSVFVLVMLLILGGLIFPGRALDDTMVIVDPSLQTIAPGGSFIVDIDCVPAQPMKAFELALSFDPTYLRANSVTAGDIFKGYQTFVSNGTIDNIHGTIQDAYGLILGAGTVSSSGTLLSISFTAKSSAGVTSIDISRAGVTDESQYLPTTVVNTSIPISSSNHPLVFSSVSPANGSVNIPVSLSSLGLRIQDPDGDHFDYTIQTRPMVGSVSLQNSRNGSKACALSSLAYGTTYRWYVNATDGKAWTRRWYTFTTMPAPVNHPPFLTAMSLVNGSVSVPVSVSALSLFINDPDGDPLSYTIQTKPGIGMVSVENTGNGTASCPIAGLTYDTIYRWYVNVTDGDSWTRQWFVFMTENAPSGSANTPVIFSGVSPVNGSTGVPISLSSLNIVLRDLNGDRFDYTVESSPDIGSASSHNARNGTKSCPVTGLSYGTTYQWFVNATDGHNWTRQRYTFTTMSDPLNSPPVIVSVSPVNGSANVPVSTSSVSVSIRDPEGALLSYTIQSRPNVGSASGNGVYNGSKSCSVSGLSYGTTYQWFVNVTDGETWTKGWYTFTTESAPVNKALVVSDANPSVGERDVPITIPSVSVAITDPEGDGFSWYIHTDSQVGSASDIDAYNGTKTCEISGLTYDTTYYWEVSCVDAGSGRWVNRSYWFVTESAPTNDGHPDNGTPMPSDENESSPPEMNTMPDQPDQPWGPTIIKRGTRYTYSSRVYDPDGDQIRLRFDWGDGTLSEWTTFSASNTTVSSGHAWGSTNSYMVTVIAQDEHGGNSSWSSPLSVTVMRSLPRRKPSTLHIAVPSTITVNETAQFDASQNSGAHGGVLTYFWGFGDGTTGTGEVPTHAYNAPGRYGVILTAMDSSRRIYRRAITVDVAAAPKDLMQEQPDVSFLFLPFLLLGLLGLLSVVLFVFRDDFSRYPLSRSPPDSQDRESPVRQGHGTRRYFQSTPYRKSQESFLGTCDHQALAREVDAVLISKINEKIDRM